MIRGDGQLKNRRVRGGRRDGGAGHGFAYRSAFYAWSEHGDSFIVRIAGL